MSLYEAALHDFTIVNRLDVDDGYGGQATVWMDGATIKGAVTFNSSNEAQVARSAGAKVSVGFRTLKKYNLYFHQVLRDSADNRVYRLIQSANLNHTPESAALDMQVWEAEEWVIPNE